MTPRTRKRGAPRKAPARSAHEPLSDATLERVARRFLALSDLSRLKVLQAVCGGVDSVAEVAALARLTQANASRHLAVLREQGFVTRRQEGLRVIYEISDDTPLTLCAAVCEHLRRSDAAAGVR
ncbi:MAG TPA: metalloregulator ArsR/SmtB family transcription factor [Planctomycetota bacterium]|nr:metalloregulator ArsR/SmtB family transcription factor [Planctomycetota bacterium]